MSHGIVGGRFLPLHRGHVALIEFARRLVDHVTVFVYQSRGAEIDPMLRVRWIQDAFPDVHVIMSGDPLGVGSAGSVRAVVPEVDHVFGSEELAGLAAELGATFVPFDPDRTGVPITGDQIRANLMEHFPYVAASTRPWLVRRVAVIGAESTGKTTLCARLRDDLEALVVPEYMRTWMETYGHLDSEALQTVARGQIAAEDALVHQATNGLVVADTTIFSLVHWSWRLFEGDPPSWIGSYSGMQCPYDLYLVCAPDFPFVGAAERDLPEERAKSHDLMMRHVVSSSVAPRPYVVLTGSREERYEAAADAIIRLYEPGKLLAARAAVLT